MTFTKEEYDYFIKIAEPIINHSEYEKNKSFFQHGETSIYNHCMSVALLSYHHALHSKRDYDYESLIRGALLHDFFLYDWHILEGRKRWHGFRHPKIAYNNAIKYFPINAKEENIIKSHMWPLIFFVFPKCREAWLVSRMDKIVSTHEMKCIKEEIIVC